MIVKNEEDVLDRCLSCLEGIADEIIIVDTGSTDGTKEIASRYTDKVFDFVWVDNFAEARNFSFQFATMDYIMWLDADDVIALADQRELKKLKNTLETDVDVVMMRYDVAFDSDGKPTFSYYRERLLNRKRGFRWVGEIHEVISPEGKIQYSDISISHKKVHPNEPQRNLHIFETMLQQGKELDPRQKYYYARELYYNGKYEEAIVQFEKFLLENRGWIENTISACKDLSVCYKLIGQESLVLQTLLRSFSYDTPRAEICCELGKYFMDRQQYKIAIYWYEVATTLKMDIESGGFFLADNYGYTPYMQICVCYDKLGNYEKAFAYNELAGKIKPNDPAYLYNQKYFLKLV